MMSKFRSADQSSDPKLENEPENSIQRLRGSIFRTITLASAPLLELAHDSPANREQLEKELLDQPIDEDDDNFEEEISVHSSELSELDLEEHLDWDSLPPMPNSFLGAGELHPSMSQYLDEKLQHSRITLRDADCFALEHSLLLCAILQLLEERALRGLAHIDIDDGVVLKQGSLKKFSHSVGRPTWKVKYAEVRRGSFSYYEDSADSFKNARKTIRLAGCTCQESRNKIGCFVFELLPENCPRRLFMCSSEGNDRPGCARSRRHNRKKTIKLGPYQWSIDTYRTLQSNIRWSLSKGEYLLHLGDLEKLKIQLPIQWVNEEASVAGVQT